MPHRNDGHDGKDTHARAGAGAGAGTTRERAPDESCMIHARWTRTRPRPARDAATVDDAATPVHTRLYTTVQGRHKWEGSSHRHVPHLMIRIMPGPTSGPLSFDPFFFFFWPLAGQRLSFVLLHFFFFLSSRATVHQSIHLLHRAVDRVLASSSIVACLFFFPTRPQVEAARFSHIKCR
jgi:hypothetical protein